MRRALFGFGSGKTKMELYVTLTDLSGAEQRLYDTAAQKNSARAPGAVIALNPYLGAAGFIAKFGMTKNAPEKTIKKTAGNIAAALEKQLKSELPETTEQAANRQ
jgi:hypothetical protein